MKAPTAAFIRDATSQRRKRRLARPFRRWPGARALVLLSLTEANEEVPHPSVRCGGEGGPPCCRQCLARNCSNVPVCGNDTNRKTQPRVANFIAGHPLRRGRRRVGHSPAGSVSERQSGGRGTQLTFLLVLVLCYPGLGFWVDAR